MRTKEFLVIAVWGLVLWLSAYSGFAATYYMNDSMTNEDVYCSAPGSDTNDGLSTSAPLASFTNLLALYSLGPNDLVYIDTGLYSNKSFSIGSGDCGSAAGYVTFQGSTNGTQVKRFSTSGYSVYLNNAPYVRFNDMSIEGGQYNAFARGSQNVEFHNVEFLDAAYTSIRLEYGSSYGRFDHCVFSGYGSYGVFLAFSTSDVSFDGCVFYYRSAIYAYSASANVSNSLFNVLGSGRYAFISDAGGSIESDYNIFHFSSGGALYSGCAFLIDHQNASGLDWNSIIMSPEFVDAGNGDYHLKSIEGRWDGNSWVTDTVHSVAIDFGSGYSPYSAEPVPNGARVNAGVFGNTYQASKSRTNRWLQALTYNDGGLLTGTGNVYWIAGNCAPTDTVRLEYSLDAGQSWGLIQSNVPATNVYTAWDTTAHASSAGAKWRVVYEAYTDTWSTIESFVTIHNTNLAFYVNDTSTVNDVYTTAEGAATNSGIDPASPKSDIAQLLTDYIISPGDIIYVDTGSYILTNRISWTSSDQGDGSSHVVLQGSTNGSVLYYASSSSDALLLNDADYIAVSNVQFQGGRYNVRVYRGRGTRFTDCDFNDANNSAICLEQNVDCNIRHCLLKDAGSYALQAISTSVSNYLDHCVIDNDRGLYSYSNSRIEASNSIFSLSGNSHYAFVEQSGGSIASDYNVYHLQDDAMIYSGINSLAEYQKNYSEDYHSTVLDPMFADPANGDYHLQSEVGRWNGTGFVQDAEHSPAIDLGYPGSDFSEETSPNGDVVNVGVFGNTSEASRSRTNEWLQALSYNDGGLLNAGEDYVYWLGGNVATDATVMIQLSRDSGSSWITVATNIVATNNAYLWSNTNDPSSVYARWRVVLESDTNVVSESAEDCAFRNGPFVYYVNDSSLDGDIYTTAEGNDSNLGVSPSTPKASLMAILDTYDLEAGDEVYIDTGVYDLTENQVINAYDSGTNGNPVRLIGSTNYGDGGSVFDRDYLYGGGYALSFSSANGPVQFVTVSDLILKDAYYGLYLSGAHDVCFERVQAYRTTQVGMRVDGCSNIVFDTCLTRNGASGFQVDDSEYVHLEHTVGWQLTNVVLKVNSGWVTATNCVFGGYGNIAYLYYTADTTNILGDYNGFSAEREAVVGYISSQGRTCNKLAEWQTLTTQEIHSIEGDLLFADPDNGDFHLKTITPLGRRTPEGGYTSDIETSPLIDSGCPVWPYGNEPSPNGGRVNIGLYGNSSQASIGRTNAWGYAATLDNGGSVQDTASLYWVLGGTATDDLVKIEYSWDGGESWSVLTSDVPAGVTEYLWDTTLTNDTPAGLWRVSSLDDTNLVYQTTNFFSVRNNPQNIYVNDLSTDQDVYTTSIGASNNWRATTSEPIDSILTVLDRYNLEPGDTVWVDSGNYTNDRNIRLGRYQCGEAASAFSIVGSTAALHSATVLDRGATNKNAFALQFESVSWVTVSNLTVQGASCGVSVSNASNVRISLCARNNRTNGVEVLNANNITLSKCILEDNARQAFYNEGSGNVLIEHSMVRSNTLACKLDSGHTVLRQNLLSQAGNGRYLYELEEIGYVDSDYNNIRVDPQASMALVDSAVYKSLSEWLFNTSNDIHSLSHDPLFGDAENGDYHLKSEAGRFTVSGIVTDTVTSALIDTGDPAGSYSKEPAPNGERVNIGLYGNNGEASRSRTNGWLLALTLNSGGYIRETNYIYWAVGGGATGHMVYVDFSEDGGVTWTNIGTNILASDERFLWDTTNQPPTALGVWRVVSQVDTGVFGQTEDFFAIKNEPLGYYINDAYTNNDVYCTEPGSALNNGLRPSTPKDSIPDLIDTYTLTPGDRVLIDTGYYILTNRLTIEDLNGSGTNFISFLGSTNYAAGGSRFYHQRGGVGFEIKSSSKLLFDSLFITNAPVGVSLLSSSGCYLNRIVAECCGNAFVLDGAVSNVLSHCCASAFLTNGLRSVRIDGSASPDVNQWDSGVLISAAWSSNTTVLTTGCCISVERGSLSVSNSIMNAVGAQDSAYLVYPNAEISADYNDYYLSNSLYLARQRQELPAVPASLYFMNLGEWQFFTGGDSNSLTVSPGFHSIQDWHLVSQEGRYDQEVEGFVTDAVSSLLLDAGDPIAVYTNETEPNGQRRNMGMYGNTTEASQTPTNSYYSIVTLNDGGNVAGSSVELQWVAHGNATGNTVQIEYSRDGGQTWTTVVSGVAASMEGYAWDTTLFSNSVFGLWRMGSVEELYDTTTNAECFTLRNGPLYFYVNDASTNGDVYCDGVGATTNDGLSSESPALSLQYIVDEYDLEGGDIVYLDTGVYTDRTQYVINQWDSGYGTNSVVICGSTNIAVGGSLLSGIMLRLQDTLGLELRNIVVEPNGRFGIAMEECTDTVLSGIHVYNAIDAFNLERSANIMLHRCIATGSISNGLNCVDTTNVVWSSGVMWSNVVGVNLLPDSVEPSMEVNNSIFAAGTGAKIYVVSGGSLFSDYNNYYLTDGAEMATEVDSPLQNRYVTVSRWVRDTGRDIHSLSRDPLFVAPSIRNFQLSSKGGRVDLFTGNTVTDAVSSCLIDAGDPSVDFAQEPQPNGGRINQGLYGNTGFAAITATNAELTVISLNDGGRTEGTNVVLYWLAHGSATSHTVILEYSPDAGENWQEIASGLPALNGKYIWDTLAFTSSVQALWRVSSQQDTFVYDESDDVFALRNAPIHFYVNDDSVAGDMYSSAIGAATNSGLTPSQPKDSIATIISTYDLESGDKIFVDTGLYDVDADIVFGLLDSAQETNSTPVYVVGSTNEVYGGSQLDCQDLYSVKLQYLIGIALDNLEIIDAGSAALAMSRAYDVSVSNLLTRGAETGVSLEESDNVAFQYCVIQEASDAGMDMEDNHNITFDNGVLWSNDTVGIRLWVSDFSFSNSIISVYDPDAYAYYIRASTFAADYNCIHLANGAYAAYRYVSPNEHVYENVSLWTRASGLDRHSLSCDPLLVAPESGDYHLKSARGHYDFASGLFVNDAETSPLIDAGPLGADCSFEPLPNGNRVNIGRYGNTVQASKSPTNASFSVLSLNDGGRTEGQAQLYWVAYGDATGHTVRLEFSADAGQTWQVIVSGIPATQEQSVWSTILFDSTMLGYWRVVSEDEAGVYAQSRDLFAVRNEPMFFYVNDDSLIGDIYSSAIGGSTNYGVDPVAPQASMQALLARWDIEPGDTIYIDTGYYLIPETIMIDSLDAGEATNTPSLQVKVIGSTEEAAGGSVFDFYTGQDGMYLYQAPGISIEHLTLRNAGTGLQCYDASFGSARFVKAEKCNTGFNINRCNPFDLSHCVAANCTFIGLRSDHEDSQIVWQNGVLWSNRYAVYKDEGSLTVENTAIASFGRQQTALYIYDQVSPLTSDYNNIYLYDKAYCAAVKLFPAQSAWTTRYETVALWQDGTGYDTFSLSSEPDFYDPVNGDFHLKSSMGRYQEGIGWTNDADIIGSRLIDSGKPASVYDDEPMPNGGRVNIGCYGNTDQASMTPTQGWVTLVFPKDPFDVKGDVPIRWITGWVATGHTMRLEFSQDDGYSWTNIVTGLPPAWNGYYLWDSELFERTARARIKVVSEDNPAIWDISERGVVRTGGTIPYYVNDNSTNGDVYCSVVGDDDNDGLTTNTPKRSIQAIFDDYRLAPVDTVFVDSGDYYLTRPLTIDDSDKGEGTNHVIIQGSTNVVVPTVLDRQGANSAVIRLNGTRGIELRDLVLRNGSQGVTINGSLDCDFVRLESSHHLADGFRLTANSETIRFVNCLSWANEGSGVSAAESEFSMENCLCWDNDDAVSLLEGSSANLTNCIMQASGSGGRIFAFDVETAVESVGADYNNYYMGNGALFAEKERSVGGNAYYAYLLDWQNGTTQDLFSLSFDPLFVQSESGNFRLKSMRGRYVPGSGWTNDSVNSPLLDLGNPGSVYTNEPSPNGGRINIGPYGNTWQASMSRTSAWLKVLSLGSGGTVRNSVDLKWTSGLFSNDSLVRLEYTANGGVSWPVIASNVNNDASHYFWDVSDLPLAAQMKWRVIWQDNTNVVDESGWFANKPRAITIYVNDNSTAGDIYTTATGSDLNSGTNPAAPFASPYTAFNRYPLGAGDTIWIDTGYYALTNGQNLEIDAFSRGDVGDPIAIWGSRQMQYGGSVIDVRNGSNSVLNINNTRYIRVSNLVLCGSAAWGGVVSATIDCELNGLSVVSNQGGVALNLSSPVSMDRCKIWNNRGYGVSVGSSSLLFDHGVVANNSQDCFYVNGSTLTLSNSIMYSESADAMLFRENNGTYVGDYNFMYTPTGTPLAYLVDIGEFCNFFIQWQQEHAGEDTHSVRLDPAFVDPSNGIYRLSSESGHFTYAGYVTDTGTSWAIDAGGVGDAYTLEPPPNGQRLNAGLYGNTTEASKSYTNEPELMVATLNDGGTMTEPPWLYWLCRGISPTNTVLIEYSYDNGVTWLYVTNGINVNYNGYYWADTNPPSPEAFWKVSLESDSNIYDTNDTKFIKRTGPITYYVNDDSLVGDIYTTAVGHPDNSGYSSNAPKDSIRGILDNPDYDLAGDDRILVDTGHYVETNTIAISAFNSGSVTAFVQIVGSTNIVDGGSVLDWSNAVSYAVSFGEEVKYVDLKDLILQGAGVGIRFESSSSGCALSNVVVRDMSGVGLDVGSSGHEVIRSVVTRCGGTAIRVSSEGSISLESCVVWSNGGSTFLVGRGGEASVSNSVIHVYSPETYCYELETNATLLADYNNVCVGSNAYYALYDGVLLLEGLPQWILQTTQDVHSLSTDPAFNDASQDDFHPVSAAGRYDPVSGGYIATDVTYSLLIDTGATNKPYGSEPDPNGGRLNIGLYGNTDEASKSDTNAWVYAITASSGGQLHGLFNLVWAYGGLHPTNTVTLDYTYDDGVHWTNIGTAVVGNGQYLWMSDIKNYGIFRWYSSPIARWRVTLDADTNIWDDTDRYFALRNEPFKYYLNDTSTVDDIYTTVIGNDTNLGFFPWAPKATLNALLDVSDLEGDDSILFDSGQYLIGSNLFSSIGLSDQGKPGHPVYIQGNTNQLLSIIINTSAVEGTLLEVDAANMYIRDLSFENGNVSLLGDAVTLDHLTVTNGSVILNGFGQAVNNSYVSRGDFYLNARTANVDRLSVLHGKLQINGTNITVSHALVMQTNSGAAVSIAGDDILLQNSTLVSGGTALRVGGDGCDVNQNIIIGSGAGNYCIQWIGGGLVSDRNNLLARDGAWIGNYAGKWERLLYWQREANQDLNSMSAEPLFVDEAGGDYHLQSLTGHWTGGGWSADGQHSPCIDFGPQLSSTTNEPDPNGNRVNLGAYGDTEQASKSLTNAWLVALTMNDGGVLRGTNTLAWNYGNLGVTDLVRIEYSADGGATWVTNATGISASVGEFSWDTTQSASSFNALWRVVLITNSLVQDQCDNSFAVRNTNVIFYVNDSSLSGDVYCGAVGDAANDGLTTNTPKDSVQHVLNAYDTEGGDRIRIDTGSYSLTQDITVIWSRGGDNEYGDMVIQGSTNFAAGGSRFYRGGMVGGYNGFNIPASCVAVADLGIFDARRGVYFWSNRYCSVDGLLLSSNMYGVYADGSEAVTTRHSRIVNNEVGVYWLRTRTADVVNCTFVNNVTSDVSLVDSTLDAIYNNIYYRSVSNAVYDASGSVMDNAFIDYNIYYFLRTNSIWEGYTNLMTWQLQEYHDFRSAITNPLMVDVVNGDYHIQSTVGRYVDGLGWIPSVLDSWGIDKGNPGSDYSMEPSVNGDRINIGAYGGTIYASKGYTNTVVYNRTLNHEAHIDYTNSLWPLIWTVQDVPTDVTFSVEYSGDNGATWYVLTNGISPYKEYHIWQTSPFFNTYAGLWRVISDDGKYSDTNDAPFDIFYGDYEITHEGLSGDLNYIVWVGAWSENYRVQYSDAWMASSNGINWYNAPTGAGPNQTPWFDAPNGGDLTYEDIESTNKPYRLYRVIWDDVP